MRCFNHQASEAVGLCKNCLKAICPDCLVDVGDGLACRGPCENEVRINNELMLRSRSAYKSAGSIYKGSAWALALFGVLVLGLSFVVDRLAPPGARNVLYVFLLAGGALLLFCAVWYYFVGKGFTKK
jgi:hypothetical protein